MSQVEVRISHLRAGTPGGRAFHIIAVRPTAGAGIGCGRNGCSSIWPVSAGRRYRDVLHRGWGSTGYLGVSLGLDPDTFRTVGAVLLIAFGAVLLVPRLQSAFARLTAGVSLRQQRTCAHTGRRVDGTIPHRRSDRHRLEPLRWSDPRCGDHARPVKEKACRKSSS